MKNAACVFLQPIKIDANSYDEDLKQTDLSNQRFQSHLHFPIARSPAQTRLGTLASARPSNSRARGTPRRHRSVLLSRGTCHLSDREDKAATSGDCDWRSEEKCVGKPRKVLAHTRFEEENKCDERTASYCQVLFSGDTRAPT